MGFWMSDKTFHVFLTFTGGQLVFQLVVPVGFGWERRLGFFFVQSVQAAFRLHIWKRGAGC